MGKAEAVVAVGELVAAFGQEDISEDRVNVYVDHLLDVDANLLRAAVRYIVSTSRFFPAVGEIRHVAARLAGLLPPSPAEALAIVRLADRSEVRGNGRGGRGYVEKFWDWPENQHIEAIQEVVARIGEPSDIDGNPRFGWENGFQKTYEVQAKSIEAAVLADLSPARLPAGSEQKRIA